MQMYLRLPLLWYLHWTSTLHAVPETQIFPQENFDLSKFMGVWYEAALVSTCPLYMQRRRGSPGGVALEMKPSGSLDDITVTSFTFRNNSCQERSTQYLLTDTPGRFFYHVARLGVDVELNVVETNYDEFAMMVLLSTERPAGTKTTILKLYGRTVNVTSEVLSKFTSLVQHHGLSPDSIMATEIKGGTSSRL